MPTNFVHPQKQTALPAGRAVIVFSKIFNVPFSLRLVSKSHQITLAAIQWPQCDKDTTTAMYC
jgi:hypothetical protein